MCVCVAFLSLAAALHAAGVGWVSLTLRGYQSVPPPQHSNASLFCLRLGSQAAGVEVGDMLVSVDNIVAETPRLLAQGLKQTGLAQSGKLVVVKVNKESEIMDVSSVDTFP